MSNNTKRVPLKSAEPPERETKQGVLNALTIDVEEYFQVSGFEGIVPRHQWDSIPTRVGPPTERLLEMLATAGVRATFFVLGWLAERQPSLVRAIHAAGHEVATHGYAHRLVYTQSPAEFRADLRRSITAIEDAIGERVDAYRAPSFSITAQSQWALDVLIDEGITLDSSIYPVRHDRYGIPGAPVSPYRFGRSGGSLWEFPPPVTRTWGLNLPVGGGGYFRLLPYAVTRWGLQRINAEGRPFAVYLHPWEFDPDQPRITCGWRQRFRHYVGLEKTESRLAQMLTEFRFDTLREALEAWQPAAGSSLEIRQPNTIAQLA
jgi:polysaccharide deacetylase family protein (PEP-CTERM system associated)